MTPTSAQNRAGLSGERALLVVLIMTGVVTSLYYFSWWFHEHRTGDPLLLLLLVIALLYVAAQIYTVWFIYLRARPPAEQKRGAVSGLTVDVFVPTYNEPMEIIERAVRASAGISYPHSTYVLDDAGDPRVRVVAQRHGARYIARKENTDNKAGNINFALDQSSGDFIVVFDVDHVPDPHFVERVLPFFSDPGIGVVQVALDHYNSNVSFVARASSEMNDEFFGVTMLGMDQCGSASVFGSNSVFRREALRAMGGYKPGLAEDLNTSIHLHATGWKSAYAPEILARGLVPADLTAFTAQQYKWARGVFDVLFQVFPRLAGRLTNDQRICYITRMTYYLAGPMLAVHLLFLLAVPLRGEGGALIIDYLTHLAPFVLAFMGTHVVANRMYFVKPPDRPFRWRGILLALGSWPVYTAAFFAAVFRTRTTYIPTPKRTSSRGQLRFTLPQLTFLAMLVGEIAWQMTTGQTGLALESVLLIGVFLVVHLGVILALLDGIRPELRLDTVQQMETQKAAARPRA